jgi:hypothetical protein
VTHNHGGCHNCSPCPIPPCDGYPLQRHTTAWAGKGIGSLYYAAPCKIMYVTARHMPCMHLIRGSGMASNGGGAVLCRIVQVNFREFLFHALR